MNHLVMSVKRALRGNTAFRIQTTTRLICAFLLGLSILPLAALAKDPDPDQAPPSGRSAGGRGCGTTLPATQSNVPSLILLTPQGRSTQTVSTRPAFAWFMRDAAAVSMEFRLYRQENDRYQLVKEIKDDQFKAPPGITVLSLAQTTPELAIGRYRWQIVLLCDRARPSGNLFAEAELEVVLLPADLKARLERTNDRVAQSSLYAQANLWYDSLGIAMSSSNSNTALKDPRSSLLNEVAMNNAERQVLQGSAIHPIQR